MSTTTPDPKPDCIKINQKPFWIVLLSIISITLALQIYVGFLRVGPPNVSDQVAALSDQVGELQNEVKEIREGVMPEDVLGAVEAMTDDRFHGEEFQAFLDANPTLNRPPGY